MTVRHGRWAAISFLMGHAVSMIGNALVMVALPWFVIETTGSAAMTGIVGMVGALPALVAGVLGGVLVDRLGGRHMSVVADVISGVSVALIPLLYLTVGLNYWVLVALVFGGAALDVPGATARRLLLPDLAKGSGMRDEAITSAYETTEGASWIVGPLLAGLLIALIGTVNLLWITAGGFLISALVVALFAPEGRHVEAESPADVASNARTELLDGFRALRADSLLVVIAFGLTLMNFLNAPFWGVVLPVHIEETFGSASRFGLLLTMLGIGTMLGGIGYGMWGHTLRARRRLFYLLGLSSFPAIVWLFVIDVPYSLLVAGVFVAGIFSGPVNPLLVNVRLERIPPAVRGRVFATFSGLAGAAIPLGMLLAGWLLEVAGSTAGMLVFALIATAFALSQWLSRPLAAMNAPAPVNAVPGSPEVRPGRDLEPSEP